MSDELLSQCNKLFSDAMNEIDQLNNVTATADATATATATADATAGATATAIADATADAVAKIMTLQLHDSSESFSLAEGSF